MLYSIYAFLTVNVAKCNIVGRMFQQFNNRTGSMYNAVLVISRVANTQLAGIFELCQWGFMRKLKPVAERIT